MKKYLIGILLLMIGFVLASCSANGTQVLVKQLRPSELIATHNTTPPYLAARSKCSSPPSVRIVNAEKNEQDYIFYTSGGGDIYITPKTLVDHIVIYMSDAFNRTGIITDQNSTNVIQVSMENIKSWYNFNWTWSATTKLKIVIPEKKYTAIYDHYDTTPREMFVAAAYTIHVITWKIITDPFVQDYILCR